MRLSKTRACVIAGLLAFIVINCRDVGTDMQHTPINLEPFISLAKSVSVCADLWNELYLIDDSLVLWITIGPHCNDHSFSYKLFGKDTSSVLGEKYESYGGSMEEINDSMYLELFHIVTSNLNDLNLGLGSSHSVIKVKFLNTLSFVRIAESDTNCTQTANKLYAIDDSLVFRQKEWNCGVDYYYSYTLFGRVPSVIYCQRLDSLTGPIEDIRDSTFLILFNIITSNLNDTVNLGLGSSHSIIRIAF